MARVVLKSGRAKPLWHGHPWAYSEAIARMEGSAEPGDVVDVVDSADRFIGRGYWNPRSQIRVRMVTRRDEPVDDALIARRLAAAHALRTRLGLPRADTTAYRLVNSEGDGLPGLVVDVYGDAAVVQFTALGLKRREEVVYGALDQLLAPRTLFEASAGGFASVEGFEAQPRLLRGQPRPHVPCLENGIALEIQPLSGQKTGAYLDQRENRRRVGALARGARVLDCYTYVGGFALAALAGGAESARAVDVSPHALERAQAHAALNRLRGLETVESDVFRFLEAAAPRSYDLVVLDPPKFARARKDVEAALKGYRRLNALALQVCAPDALLATSSCSQLVGLEEFERMLAAAALDAGRRIQVLETAAMGPDHPLPAAFAEGRYLKFALCRVTDL
ncbi:MAG TPA: class I SAM-dependent rRNA methyltransferase [Polyangia bacterium]|nr:class I SAM-dependent rRNA methyltransferase [Polyangia bacterium]